MQCPGKLSPYIQSVQMLATLLHAHCCMPLSPMLLNFMAVVRVQIQWAQLCV